MNESIEMVKSAHTYVLRNFSSYKNRYQKVQYFYTEDGVLLSWLTNNKAYFLLPFRELVVAAKLNPLSLAQTAQYHFSAGGCLRPTQAR
jgi:hypothetical protein